MMWRRALCLTALVLSVHGQRDGPSGQDGRGERGEDGRGERGEDGRGDGDLNRGMSAQDTLRDIRDPCRFVDEEACDATEGCSYGPIQGRGRGQGEGGRGEGGRGGRDDGRRRLQRQGGERPSGSPSGRDGESGPDGENGREDGRGQGGRCMDQCRDTMLDCVQENGRDNREAVGECVQENASDDCAECLADDSDGTDDVEQGCRSSCLDLDEDTCGEGCVWQQGRRDQGRGGQNGRGDGERGEGGRGEGGRGGRDDGRRRLQQGERPSGRDGERGEQQGRDRPCQTECAAQQETCRGKMDTDDMTEDQLRSMMRSCMDEETEKEGAEECASCLENLGDRAETDAEESGEMGRCIPAAEEVNTGLLVTVTFYTDQECTELLEIDQDQNRGADNTCRGLEEAECVDDCEWESEGRGRLSTPHCKTAGDRFQRGDDDNDRPCQTLCQDVAPSCRAELQSLTDRNAARTAMLQCMQKLGNEECQTCLDENNDDGRRRLQEEGRQQGQRGENNSGRQPNRETNNQGRGQDGRDRGRGGNPSQNNRIQENPTMRVVPVQNDDGSTKCSFDSRGDQQAGVFRETVCTDDNTMQDQIFTDSDCEEEAERETLPIQRGICMPLPMQGQSNQRDTRGQGQGQGQGEGRGEDGRRRLTEEEAPGAPSCDGEWNHGWTWETLSDMWNELTCDDGEAEEGGDRDREGRRENPCVTLERNACTQNDECELQQDTCVWANPEDNRRNIYVVYDWQYLIEDGELTDTEWCYSDSALLKDAQDYNDFCAAMETQDECLESGCKKFKEKKGIATCSPQPKKVKCKKLGAKKDSKTSENKKALCETYSLLGDGCSWSDKKGCTGTINLKK